MFWKLEVHSLGAPENIVFYEFPAVTINTKHFFYGKYST